MTIKSSEIIATMTTYQKRINTILKTTIDPQYPQPLYDAIQHSLLAKSKQIRPILVYSCFQLFESNLSKIDALATAIEMIHTYSLIHDDLPAMDNDDLRRGQPTCHKAFGEDIAILAGDTLNTNAFEILSEQLPQHFEPQKCLEAIRYLSHAAGGNGMTGGQTYDLTPLTKSPSLSKLKQIHKMKTGALFTAATVIPAILCNASQSQKNALAQFGYHLGLLFQITDDILDVTGSKNKLGKTPQKDLKQNKTTYVTLLGLKAAKEFAQKEAKNAIQSIQDFDKNQTLVSLTNYIKERHQ